MTVDQFDHPTSTPPAPTSETAGAEPDEPGSAGPGRDTRRVRTAALIQQAHAAPAERREELLEEVIRLNIPVAHSLAARYRNRGQALEDLEQVACLALTRAGRHFTPDRGDDLLVFAVPSILGELKRYFRDATWAVRPPRRLQELRPRLAAAEADVAQEVGRTPTTEELAEVLEVSVEEVREARLAGRGSRTESLDRPRTESDEAGTTNLVDLLPVPDPEFDRIEARPSSPRPGGD